MMGWNTYLGSFSVFVLTYHEEMMWYHNIKWISWESERKLAQKKHMCMCNIANLEN